MRIFEPGQATRRTSASAVTPLTQGIRVQSTVGVGAAFNVVVPVHSGGVLPQAIPGREVRPPVRASGHRVLVIDDEEPVAKVVARALTSKLGRVVECAGNGHEALAALERSQFELVLSDIRMPSMNGAVFMTGDGRSSALNAAIERAKQPELRKPFTLDALLQMATDILDARP